MNRTKKKHKILKVGHTRYLPCLQNNENDDVLLLVHHCYVTGIKGNTVYYDSGYPYVANKKWFLTNTLPTFNLAVKKVKEQYNQTELSLDYL